MVKRQKSKKKKEHSAHKSSGSGSASGSGSGSAHRSYKNKKHNRNKNRTGNASSCSPFNVQPMNKKQQSRNDKIKFLRSKGVTGKAALKLAKSGKKLAKVNSVSKRSSGGAKGKPKKDKNGGGGGSRKFTVKLPQHIPHVCNTPWYELSLESGSDSQSDTDGDRDRDRDRDQVVENNNNNGKNQKQKHLLPPSYYSLPKSSLASFQKEIDAFVQYIRLTPHEIAARNSVIEKITELSHELWDEGVEIQPFGSFATLSVCTFQSDIDLALWNVVPAENVDDRSNEDREDECGRDRDPMEEYVFGEKSGVVMSESSLYRTMKALKNSNPHQQRKEDRINEWKKVLEEVDLANSSPSKEADEGTSGKARSTFEAGAALETELDIKKEEAKEDGAPFGFIIDRVGIREKEDCDGADDDDDNVQEEKKEVEKDSKEDSKLPAKSNQSQEIIVIDDDDSENDDENVDKMNAFHQRQHAAELGISTSKENDDKVIYIDSSSDDENSPVSRRTRSHDHKETKKDSHKKNQRDEARRKERTPLKSRTRSQKPSLTTMLDNIDKFDDMSSSSEGEADDEFYDDPEPEVKDRGNDEPQPVPEHEVEVEKDEVSYDGFELNISKSKQPPKKMQTIGPTGDTRVKVVKALNRMGKSLWKASFCHSLQVRRHARVPIIVATTRYGFDADVALAGHNGTDTSHYVRTVVEKFERCVYACALSYLFFLLQ
jgi:hypothetical protein